MEVPGHLISNISLEKQMGAIIILTYVKNQCLIGLIHIEIYTILWTLKGNPQSPIQEIRPY